MTLNHAQIAAAVYQACTTYDQYLPQLSPEVARSWAKVFAYYNLEADDLLAAVDRVYADQGAGYRPLPADIAKVAREIRKDRTEREGWADLEARQDIQSLKAEAEVKSIAAAFKAGPTAPTERLKAARDRLDSCQGKRESQAAIHEFFAAKRAAPSTRPTAALTATAKIAAARQSLDAEQADA